MRRDIEFDAEGCRLRGWLYTPEAQPGPSPAVVMAHGYSAVKEQYLDRYAAHFAAAGLAALVFDNRGFGASDGEQKPLAVDPQSLAIDPQGVRITPTLIHRALRQVAGLSGTPFDNAFPLLGNDLPLFG